MTQIFLSLTSHLLFVRPLKKDKKEDTGKEEKIQKRVIDDKDRHKPYGKTAWAPVDDVYIMRYYPRTIYDAADAIDMLKKFQALDFTPHKQPVYIDLRLNMKLEKKVTSPQLCSSLEKKWFLIRVVQPRHKSKVFPVMSCHTGTWNE